MIEIGTTLFREENYAVKKHLKLIVVSTVFATVTVDIRINTNIVNRQLQHTNKATATVITKLQLPLQENTQGDLLDTKSLSLS